MSKWQFVQFQDLYLIPSRNGLTKPRKVRGSGFPMINMGELFAYDRISSQPMELVPLTKREIDNYSVQPGDLLFARQSLKLEGVGKCSIVTTTPAITTFESHLIRVRLNNKIASPYYYYYYFTSSIGKAAIQSISYQVAAAGMRGSDLAKLSIPFPPLPTQRKIAAILSAYDDLIENNNRRIKILEEMAQLIYKEWFVDFRFPGHENVKMVESELGLIPEGWEVKKLGEVLDTIESGSRPKGGIKAEYVDISSIGAENIIGIGQYDYSKEKFINHSFFENMKKGIIRDKDVLLYKDGAQIGRKSMFQDGFPHKKCCINEHVFILRTNGSCSQAYLYFWLDQPQITERIINLNANAAQPGINQQGVKSLPILIADKEVANKFELIVEPILGLLFNLAKQKRILQQCRDLLLPKLISGELDVEDLDIDVGEIQNE